MHVSISPANRTSPGFLDNRERWVAARITASHLRVFLEMYRDCPASLLKGDEFEAARELLIHVMASCGVFIDRIQTVTTLHEILEVHTEFYQMCVAKS
jgi:hypothetical protein